MGMRRDACQAYLEQRAQILGQSSHQVWRGEAHGTGTRQLCKVSKKAFVGPGLGQTGGVTEAKANGNWAT